MARVLLTLVFYGIVTPIGFIGRVFGIRFLALRRDRHRTSYWHAIPPEEQATRDYASPY